MIQVSHHVIESYLTYRELVERLEAGAKAETIRQHRGGHYVPLLYADATATPFVREASLANYSSFNKRNKGAFHMQGFLATCKRRKRALKHRADHCNHCRARLSSSC